MGQRATSYCCSATSTFSFVVFAGLSVVESPQPKSPAWPAQSILSSPGFSGKSGGASGPVIQLIGMIKTC